MNNSIMTYVNELRKNNISDIKGMAFVSDDSYEVFFYGMVGGRMCQSNNMIEENLVDISVVEGFYEHIKDCILASDKYQHDKMNIITFDDKGYINIKVEELDCRIYKIKKKWKEEEGLING